MVITMSNDILFLSLVIFAAIMAAGWFFARHQATKPVSANMDASAGGNIMAQLQSQLQARDAKILVLETELVDVRAEIKHWRTKVEELTTALSVFQTQMNDERNRGNALRHENITLHSEVQRLKNERSADLQTFPPNLRTLLTNRLQPVDIKTLCFEMGIDEGTIGGETLPEQIMGMLDYAEKRQRVGDLLAVVRRVRSDIKV